MRTETLIIRKHGLRNWSASVSGAFIVTNIPSPHKAMEVGTTFREFKMGMQDNPLIGEYTKGVSANPHRYFRKLEKRIRREKFDAAIVASDVLNSFQIVQRVANGQDRLRLPPKKLIHKASAPVSPPQAKNQPKKWRATSLDMLQRDMGKL